ncbi:MAG: hypothetical protein AAGC58_12640 [Asticcacaulis sp.]
MCKQVAVRCVYRTAGWRGNAFVVTVAVDGNGVIHGIELSAHVVRKKEALIQLDRALAYCRLLIADGAMGGGLVADVLRELPDTLAFEIERLILLEVAAVQMLHGGAPAALSAVLSRRAV